MSSIGAPRGRGGVWLAMPARDLRARDARARL